MTFKPSNEACLARGCYCMAGNKKITICLMDLENRALEKLSECPRDAVSWMMCPINPENPMRDVSVSGFIKGLTLFGGGRTEKYRADNQEVISCIVRAARNAGFEIPED